MNPSALAKPVATELYAGVYSPRSAWFIGPRKQADIFLLHNPNAADLADGAALDCLSALKQEGRARCIVRRSSDFGQSCFRQAR
jgi:hypothetical protein